MVGMHDDLAATAQSLAGGSRDHGNGTVFEQLVSLLQAVQ